MGHAVEVTDTACLVVPVGRGGPPKPVTPFTPPSARALSEEHQSHLGVVAWTFGRDLRGWLSARTRAEVSVVMAPAARFTWGDLVADLPDRYCAAPFDAAPLGGPGMISVDLPLATALVDRMLGGGGEVPEEAPALTEVGTEVMSELHQHVLGTLAHAMRDVLALRPSVGRQGSRLELVRTARPGYPTVVLRFELAVGTATGDISVALPAEAVLGALEALSGVDGSQGAAASLDRRLLGAPVTVSVRFDPVLATPAAILALEVGDVVTLPHPRTRGLTVWAGDRPLLEATAGRRGERLAVAITATTPHADTPGAAQ